MFSLQQLFGKGDKFHELLEAAAQEAHESVRLTIEIIKSPRNVGKLNDLVLARHKEKQIFEEISSELVRVFLTGLEREDIEALARGLYKIPKAAKKIAERFLIATSHLDNLDFSRQADMMADATAHVRKMVKQLRQMGDLETMRKLNDELQYIENEAEILMNNFLREFYADKYGLIRGIVIRDIYELIEKLIDRCFDVGSVVMQIILKNS